jgi:hypothetical protein
MRRMVLGVLVATSLAGAALAGAHSGSLATRLAGRDPGGRVDGSSVVLTGAGGQATGVRGRQNFMAALGSGEKLVGGGKDDELGAVGPNDVIVAGKSHELLVGGPRGHVVVGGQGHDLVLDSHPDATIVVESPNNEVVASGRGDRVLCSQNASHEVIRRGRDDLVQLSCREHHGRVLGVVRAARPATVARATQVVGEGTASEPYTAGCSAVIVTDCEVTAFPARALNGLWANEYVPAYRCPPRYPYLVNGDWVPSGTIVPPGVEIEGLGPIGVSITVTLGEHGGDRATGTSTGFPDSSATNWTFGTAHYKVILHCTNSPQRGYSDQGWLVGLG